MDLVFNNVYLLETISLTDPSLEVFFKLLMSVPLFARVVNSYPAIRNRLYKLHARWLYDTWTPDGHWRPDYDKDGERVVKCYPNWPPIKKIWR
jgi:hypothetical protein